MHPKSQVKLFAGPSLSALSIRLAEENNIEILSPVKRHDFRNLIEAGLAGTFIVADGIFHQVLSVGHAEIRDALQKGIEVFGLCSMGAIRAYEMRNIGMKGFGEVYESFFHYDDFQDDELCLVHESVAPYRTVSEPLIHFRFCLRHLIEKKLVTEAHAMVIIDSLKKNWFGDRTMNRFQEVFHCVTGINFQELAIDFEPFRVKKRDLENFLTLRPWDTDHLQS